MSQENNTIYYAQTLLIQWLSCFNFRRYELIKSACENLCDIIKKNKEYALHDIFYPLFYSGVIEYAGNSGYTLPPPVLITGKENRCILVIPNSVEDDRLSPANIPAIWLSNHAAEFEATLKESHKTYKFNLNTILKKLPCISGIAETFDKSPHTPAVSKPKIKAKLEKSSNGFTYQLIHYQQHTRYEVPGWEQNPDAVNIAGYYERILCEMPNGHYDAESKQLKLLAKRIPVMLYRPLLIHTLLAGHTVEREQDTYTFPDISYPAYRELNRILCNSINIQP